MTKFFTLILTVWGYIPDMLDSNFHNEKKNSELIKLRNTSYNLLPDKSGDHFTNVVKSS